MAYRIERLPSRFPVGTKFVIEGRGGGEGRLRVSSRYLEFPDGTCVPLPAKTAARKPRAGKMSAAKRRSRAARTRRS